MARLDMMEEEFRARRMEEHKCAAAFSLRREMECEQDKEKREEWEWKREKARRAKAAFLKGGEEAQIKGK
jgi:phosphoglycerate dehydrogenase-like enzyme